MSEQSALRAGRDSQLAGTERRKRLAAARLYLVCPPWAPASRAQAPAATRKGDAGALVELIEAAAAGGVDVVQVREKHASDEQVLELAAAARQACDRQGALLIVNDRPDLALRSQADGVHVGQDDMPLAQAREVVGPEVLIGLSTHSVEQIDAVDTSLADYIGVGPVHATPTKPGRPAVGLAPVRHAAEHARLPFFAIGGIDAGNLEQVLAAGARRVCILRAIADAADPERTARSLRAVLDARALEG